MKESLEMRCFIARLRGLDALRRFFETDEEAQREMLNLKPGEDLQAAIGQFIRGMQSVPDHEIVNSLIALNPEVARILGGDPAALAKLRKYVNRKPPKGTKK